MSTAARQDGPATPGVRRQRATRQRAAVADILSRTEEFRSAQQIHAALDAEGTRVGLATVYRNLTALAGSGEVDQIRNAEGETLYRRCDAHSHHHHLVCRSCGTTVEVSAAPLETWVARISQKNGFTDVEHTAELFGLCAACSARQG
ncbi:Fur family transcriptional regulator [Actinomyces sp. oral taxon 897]|uniref:Fur family transcriptional regulator n=1 Tax=Actinomyces sp. oral taxon 897 TaxID=2081702 RepID=UPI000D03FCAA|nr:Fur family transcriptional regulator [Actinomyces sp. oral taxon 897]AVM61169.1 transcriptional repressor [Actinomyces sp. oral taxon 897]